MTLLSKHLMYGVLGVVGAIAFGEAYYYLAEFVRKKLSTSESETNQDPDEEINELVCCRQPVNKDLRLCKGIEFSENEFKHTTQILEHLIKSSRRSILLAMYSFSSETLANALIEAHEKGVRVSIVIELPLDKRIGPVVLGMKQRGIGVLVFRKGAATMHNKIVLFDVPFDEASKKLITLPAPPKAYDATIPLPTNGLMLTGSLNWTKEALTSNRENFIASSNKKVCEAAAVEFFDIWNSSEMIKTIVE